MPMVVKAWALDQWFQLHPRMLAYVVLRPHPSPLGSETLGWGPAICFNKYPFFEVENQHSKLQGATEGFRKQ